MHTIGSSAYRFQAVRQFNRQLTDALLPVIQQLQGLVINAATLEKTDARGQHIRVIPLSHETDVLLAAGDLIQRFFVGSDLRSAFGRDGITPLAPYTRLLNDQLAWVTYQVVNKQTEYMHKRLPPDIRSWLSIRLNREQFTGNPLAQYEAPHLWVDARGYRLSDRIWQTSIETRRKVDALLADGIRNGRGALDMAKDLEAFLLPGRAGLKTTKPYGTKASYDAMRLGRTEITRAAGTASLAASRANPFVDGMDWRPSLQHPRFDECDQLATIDVNGQRIREPYPVDGYVPLPCVDSHPVCLCSVFPAVTRSSGDVIDELRAQMDAGDIAPLTPVDSISFTRQLIGDILGDRVKSFALSKILQKLGTP